MAKETREQHMIRGMLDQVTEHLYELKGIAANPDSKELHIENWCQSLLKSCLGFAATSDFSIRAQQSKGKLRPDVVISKKDVPICVVEVKKLNFDLDKSDLRSGKSQLSEYLHAIGTVKWGVLTNGYEWRLYDFSSGSIQDVLSFDLRGETGELDLSKKAIEETCWVLADLHATNYENEQWSDFAKEATAFSPDSLARAILSADSVKYIAKAIRGEFDYKVNTEILFDKLKSLVENGLDDLARDWNETKQAELHKYVSTQKRVSRKKHSAAPSRKSKEESTGENLNSPNADSSDTSKQSEAISPKKIAA